MRLDKTTHRVLDYRTRKRAGDRQTIELFVLIEAAHHNHPIDGLALSGDLEAACLMRDGFNAKIEFTRHGAVDGDLSFAGATPLRG